MKRLVAFAAALLCATAAFAQYPSKPVHIVVPFPRGGTTDLIARLIQPKLQQQLGQTIFMENWGGAGGAVGAAEAAKSAPDGHTLLMVFNTHATNHHIYKLAPDPFKTFEHISLMVTSPGALVAAAGFAPDNLRGLVAYAKANPAKVTYATPGAGSANHLAVLLLERYGDVKMTQVGYHGGGPMIQALLRRYVDIAFVSAPLVLPHVKSGKVKAIAVGSRQRIAQLPEVPTLAETYPGFEQISWFGILGPAGLAREVVARVHRDMVRTLQAPEVSQRLTEQGFDVVAGTPEEFLAFVQNESDKFGRVIRDHNLTID